jgi:myo-inositol-1(or 4)-monophosphatase
MQGHLTIAVRAARRAGDLIVRSMNRSAPVDVTSKEWNELVTEVDLRAEEDIKETIRRSYPDHAFLGEETGASGDSDCVWIIDPLDGTTNFIHKFPIFAVSIALQVRGQLEAGVIYDPMRQEMFTASRGEGAQLDGRRIRVGNAIHLKDTLIGTGFPYRENVKHMDDYLAMLKAVVGNVSGVRRPGAAAIDLAYVAAGRFDGFWELGLKPWDIAAGALLIQEAGGIISSVRGDSNYLETGHVIAGSPKIHQALSDLLYPLMPASLKR